MWRRWWWWWPRRQHQHSQNAKSTRHERNKLQANNEFHVPSYTFVHSALCIALLHCIACHAMQMMYISMSIAVRLLSMHVAGMCACHTVDRSSRCLSSFTFALFFALCLRPSDSLPCLHRQICKKKCVKLVQYNDTSAISRRINGEWACFRSCTVSLRCVCVWVCVSRLCTIFFSWIVAHPNDACAACSNTRHTKRLSCAINGKWTLNTTDQIYARCVCAYLRSVVLYSV